MHEDSAAYTVSTAGLTLEVEVVTYVFHWIASRGDSQTTHAVILTELATKSGTGSPDAMCRWSTSTLENSRGCTALDMPE